MQSISVFLNINEVAGFWWKNTELNLMGVLHDLYMFWIFVKYNRAKFHHCRICMVNFREGAFLHSDPWAAPKGPNLNMINRKNTCQGISSSIVYSILLIYHESSSIIICHADVCNAAYSKPYRSSCFKQVKHLQNLNIKNSKSQEPKYT